MTTEILSNGVIHHCTCENNVFHYHPPINDIDLLICKKCQTLHQYLPNWTEKQIEEFYQSRYHTTEQTKIGCTEYEDRYDHDYRVSQSRLDSYAEVMKPGTKFLDIGSSNSAFVHAARDRGFDGIGIEMGLNIGDDSVTVRANIKDANFAENTFDFITLHDVIEHIVDPVVTLKKIKHIGRSGGILVIDLPNYWTQEGRHHWRPVQHLWYWNKDQMCDVLTNIGFSIIKIEEPIPGKLVFYSAIIKDKVS
jgi:SAM-dependent methyltransferase